MSYLSLISIESIVLNIQVITNICYFHKVRLDIVK